MTVDKDYLIDHLLTKPSQRIHSLPARLRLQSYYFQPDLLPLDDSAVDGRHFECLGKLGEGNYAAIYLARLRGNGFLMALKVQPKDLFRGMAARIPERELHAMTNIHSRFIPSLFYSWEAENHLCMAMEWMPQGDLFSLNKHPGATPFQAKAYCY